MANGRQEQGEGSAKAAPEAPLAASAADGGAPAHLLPFRLLPVAASSWDPASINVTLNVRLDGCIVPSEATAEGARIAYSHAVVIDDFIPDETRRELLSLLLGRQVAATSAGGHSPAEEGAGGQLPSPRHGSDMQLPEVCWERRTTDMAGAAPTWGVKQHVLQELAAGRMPAMQEVHARLCKLYPECDIAHLPSDAIQLQAPPPEQPQQLQSPPDGQRDECQAQQQWHLRHNQHPPAVQQQPGQQQQQPEEQQGSVQPPPAKRSKLNGGSGSPPNGGDGRPAVDCACFVANAAVSGDSFRYHVDADPTSFPDGSPWHAAYGDYFNGEPGKPLLVSLLLYLNEDWRREWGGDTLFLDGTTETGVFVAPRPGRAVLFDQDILHRVTPPLDAAGGRPRFSLVWKLAMLPRRPGQALCLARPEWGPPSSFGSAARVGAVMRRLLQERRQGRP